MPAGARKARPETLPRRLRRRSQEEITVINELSMLFDIARVIAWFAFGAAFLIAAGLAIFGGHTRPATKEEKLETFREAA